MRKTLVFLHGWVVGPENYKSLINSLSQKYHVIAPNLSDLTDNEDFSWQKFAENLDKLITKNEIYLLGISLGGGLALAYTAFYSNKVKAVIVCEPAGIKIKRSKLAWVFLLAKMSTRALFYPGGIEIVSGVCCSFFRECIFNFRKVLNQARLGLEKDLEKSLPRIKAPVYLLWSKNSDLLPSWIGEKLHQRIPASKFNQSFADKNHLWSLFEQEKIVKEVFKIF